MRAELGWHVEWYGTAAGWPCSPLYGLCCIHSSPLSFYALLPIRTGWCLRPRWDGNEEGLTELARKNATAIGAGHRSAAACAGRQAGRLACRLAGCNKAAAGAGVHTPEHPQQHQSSLRAAAAFSPAALNANLPLRLTHSPMQLHHFYE